MKADYSIIDDNIIFVKGYFRHKRKPKKIFYAYEEYDEPSQEAQYILDELYS